MKPHWYGIGGGKPDDPRMAPHYQRVAAVAAARTTAARPPVALLPAAHRNGLHPALTYRGFMVETFKKLGCAPVEILIGDVPEGESPFTPEEVAQVLAHASALFVLGGDTRYLLEICRSQAFTPLFQEAFLSGLPFCGSSAGCIWLSRTCMSDSECFETPDNWRYIELDGLGLLPFFINVHDNQGLREGVHPAEPRRSAFERMFRNGGERLAIAIDEFVALELCSGVLDVVGNSPERGAYILRRSGDDVIREPFTGPMRDSDLAKLVSATRRTPPKPGG
jgi:peptidase E